MLKLRYLRENHMKVSIVVPCFNEEVNIKPCLESLVALDYTDDFEIVVIDNNSTDCSQAIITDFALLHPFIRLSVEYKKGTAVVRNKGIKTEGGFYRNLRVKSASLISPKVPDNPPEAANWSAPGTYWHPAYKAS